MYVAMLLKSYRLMQYHSTGYSYIGLIYTNNKCNSIRFQPVHDSILEFPK